MRTTMSSVRPLHRTVYFKQKDTEIYKSVKSMIQEAAHSFSRSYGLEFEDVLAQANLIFTQALKLYTPARNAKFSSFLYFMLQSRLITYGQRQTRMNGLFMSHTDDEQDIFDMIPDSRAQSQFEMAEVFESLTEHEQQLVNAVLSGFASTMQTLKKLALRRLSFNENQFDEAVAGIRQALGVVND